MLSVPEEYAGQMMKCPLCNGTFTMPTLPSKSGAAAAPSKSGGPPLPPSPPPDTFDIRLPPSGVLEPKPLALPVLDADMAMEPVMMEPAPRTYRHALPLRFNPVFLRWLVPVCLIAVVVFSIFFPWIGSYPGGVTIVSQTGWQAAFGDWTKGQLVEDLRKAAPPIEAAWTMVDVPKASLLLILYQILTWLAVLLAIAFIVFNLLPANTGGFIRGLRRWQGLILGGVALLAFAFLLIETLAGFKLRTTVANQSNQFINEEAITKTIPPNVELQDKQKQLIQDLVQAARGAVLGAVSIRYTWWFRLAYILLLLAAIGGLLEFWGVRRGKRPPPKIEFAW
jgi:hypothetical protein